MNQQAPSSFQVSPLPSHITPHGTTFIPVEMSASGALLLGPYQTKDAYMEQFQELKQAKETLEKAGYVMQALAEDNLAQKQKCSRCHKSMFKKTFKRTNDGKPKSGSDLVARPENHHTLAGSPAGRPSFEKTYSAKVSKQECKYHDGTFNGRMWSCCKAGIYNQPCKTSAEHVATEYKPGELEELHRYYSTPAVQPSKPRCLAVAIDCEMGTSITNNSVLIRVTLIDYFTSKVLLDKLVFPDEPVLHYNTRFSGVTYGQMAKAKARGECLYGTAAARKAIWKFVGPDTIVVAHGGQNDMSTLRWIHSAVVDTHLVESLPVVQLQREAREKEAQEKEAREQVEKLTGSSEKEKKPSNADQKKFEPKKKKPKGSGQFSLKTLARERLGREIQMGNAGHDSVEDAMAARDIAHWNVLNFGHGVYSISTD
ncbi:hypothetical protein VMCG_00706 [Cytospora schulzeri]|uniref:Exonuclease domain-containing protein n=1 Tax=Cytospora schulzeri TaxID=448051 RepID=A0A423X820_9PEZI|nr:hypothetical protein VMCG_00706 [Valsa malicola]